MAERLRRIKEEPLIDERVPHPYREFAKELKAIRILLEEISQKLPVITKVPAVPPVVQVPAPIVKVPPPTVLVTQLTKEQYLTTLVEALQKVDVLKFANDLHVQPVDLSTDRSTDALIEEFTKLKNAIALSIFRNTGTFDLYINEKNKDHKLTIDALTYPQTFLLDWFDVKTIYVGNAAQSGKEATLIAWKRVS